MNQDSWNWFAWLAEDKPIVEAPARPQVWGNFPAFGLPHSPRLHGQNSKNLQLETNFRRFGTNRSHPF
jgi:hypothetical protein